MLFVSFMLTAENFNLSKQSWFRTEFLPSKGSSRNLSIPVNSEFS